MEGSNKNIDFWQIISDKSGVHGNKLLQSAQIIEFCNYGNTYNFIKVIFAIYKECGNKNIGFWKIT